jgi:hypothetical protein
VALMSSVWIARALTLIALAIWTMRLRTFGAASDSVLHLPNIVFHEAGHVIFSLFGGFMASLGGSLLQVLIPIIVTVAFLRQHNGCGAAVGLWWTGENLLDVAPYIADARRLQMTLLGGRTGAEVEGHDWEFILSELGWLHLDQVLALAAHRLGFALMACAIGYGAFVLRRDIRARNMEHSIPRFPREI